MPLRAGSPRRARTSIAGLAALTMALGVTSAEAAEPADPSAFLACMARFYSATPEQGPGGAGLKVADGPLIPLGDGQIRSLTERANTPTLRELFLPPYTAGPLVPARGDPGRTRRDALLGATYGATERAVGRALVPWRFHGQHFSVHPRALAAVEAVGARLEKLLTADPSLAPLFEKMGGTWNWRSIAGTQRRSAHAYGIAVDLNPKLGDYWRDAKPPRLGEPRNHVPESVVAAFEAEGFIWGGRWSHYDTMHFEWRPELFACAKELPPATPAWTYPWLTASEGPVPKVAGNLEERFATPAGFHRVDLPADSFGSFLRTLPMAAPGTPVVSFRGESLYTDGTGGFVAAVTALDVGEGDLQQCADSVIRLHAEWLWALGLRNHRYSTVSGTALSLADYLAGIRFHPHGNQLVASPGSTPTTATRAAFRGYLNEVFEWANTASLRREGRPVTFRDLMPGDYVVMEGKPWGHAVLVLDAARAADGRLALLLGESAIPAQSFHVIEQDPSTGPWFILAPDAATLITPVWDPFPESALRRMPLPAFPDE